MDDHDNLPFGTSTFDAFTAGVNKWDDPHIAAGKLVTQDLARANDLFRQQNSTEQSSMPFSDSTPAHFDTGDTGGTLTDAEIQHCTDIAMAAYHRSVNKDAIKKESMMGVHNLAQEVEGKREILERKRENETSLARKVRRAAIAGAVVTVCLVYFSINLPFVPYEYIFAEYLGVRIALIASVVCIFKSSSRIKKAFSREEKRQTTIGECIRQALQKSGGFVNIADSENYQTVIVRGVKFPKQDLTSKFLVAFNEAVLKATGEPMPYSVYRFRDEGVWKKALFIPRGNVLSDLCAQISDPVSLEELKKLAISE